MYREILPLLIVLLMFAIAAYADPLVKTDQNGQMITHWGIDGKANGWSPKIVGLYALPLLTLVIYLILLAIPKIDVYPESYKEFSLQFWGFRVVLVFVMGVIFIGSLIPNLGYWNNFDIMIVVVPAIALLFFYVGYMLNFTKRNFFVGVRTPWTLADEKVWDKTNKFTGKLFWVCSALTFVSLVAPGDWKLWVIIVPLVLVAIAACVYSYVEYQKTKKSQEAKGRRKKKR